MNVLFVCTLNVDGIITPILREAEGVASAVGASPRRQRSPLEKQFSEA